MLKIDSHAPDFTLYNQDGIAITLSEQLRHGPVLLYFYPADFTPGCTKEACSLRDLFPRTEPTGLKIFGVSSQDAASHRRFREEHRLPFDLLCDEDKRVIREYDCDGPFGFGVRRVTYFIDGTGIIRDAVQADFRIGRHTELVQKLIDRATPGN